MPAARCYSPTPWADVLLVGPGAALRSLCMAETSRAPAPCRSPTELDAGDGDSMVGKAWPCGPLASGAHQFAQPCLLKSRGFKEKAFFVRKFYRKGHFLEIKLFARAQKSQFRKKTWELMLSCKSELEGKLPKSCQPCGYSPQLGRKGPKSSSSDF